MMINIRDYEIADRAKKEGIQQGIEQGISQGAEQKAIETAKNLLSMNLSLEQIAQATSLPLEKVQKLKEVKSKIFRIRVAIFFTKKITFFLKKSN